MTFLATPSGRAHRRLLLSGAGAALVVALAPPLAQAQAVDVYASGPHTLINQQANDGAPTQALAIDVVLESANGAVRESAIALSNNTVSGAARGALATNSLAPEALDLASGYGPTYLTAGPDGVEADGGAVIASAQSNVGSPTTAETTGSRIAIDARRVAGSQLGVDGNLQEAAALGADGASSLALTGVEVADGAGIASLQTTDEDSGVTAKFRGQAEINARRVSASDLTLTDNLQRAIAYGAAVDNTLSVEAGGLAAPAGYGLASMVPAAGDGDPSVEAAYGLLSHQVVGGSVTASAGGRFDAAGFDVVTGDLDASAVKVEGNGLVAASYGAQSANGLDLDAVSITRSGDGESEGGDQGAVANVTAVQRIDDADITAITHGGAAARLAGDVDGSSVSVSRNDVRTLATGNLADGNRLTAHAVDIDAPGDDGFGGGEVGSALWGYDDSLFASAAFSVQNAQDYGHGAITAIQAGRGVDLIVQGDTDRSTLEADANGAAAAATGNSAVNDLVLQATALRTSADLNSLQLGGGDVRVSLGSPHHRSGAVIALAGEVADASLSVSGNTATGAAIGNTATSSLTATADAIANGSDHGDAEAGPLPDGFGAAANFALANAQQLGDPENEEGSAVEIASNVAGRYGVIADGSVARSSVAVDDNAQTASAIGDTAVNRLAVSATRLEDEESPAAGSALSSLQLADAEVHARSDMRLSAPGAMTDSEVSLSGNANQALAGINDVDNGLRIDAAWIGAVTGGDASASADTYGPSQVTGDHVLNNAQFASGAAEALAATRIDGGDGGGSLTASRLSIDDNETRAEAFANRALNRVSVTAATGGGANAGLGSFQLSEADVTATAVTDAYYAANGSPWQPAVNGSSVGIDGNSTAAMAHGNLADNQVDLLGVSGGAWPPTPEAVLDAYGSRVHAAAVLLNGQVNEGAVSATSVASGYGVGLDSWARISGSSLGVTGNAILADAYGNAASNQITLAALDRPPTAAISNVQSNHGPVTAQVIGARYSIVSGSVGASALVLSGNQLAASATGNQATNAIASPR